ncbi:unnamed protein product [Clonostachys chloroleuca]|uniref:NADP-dependent oxidoreductase domain-containing protein n=1 Tax=Clonostachys chloroleuca TaxID=1926264 RepID=A0AA35PXQ6_9HYPO|nr:unnamed protein product [Clonostachys chloroleuca]
MSSSPKIRTVKLQDGAEIPMPDRFSAYNPDAVTIFKYAIAAGYRHLDTAEAYGTERELGQAIKESGVPREDMLVITKTVNSLSEDKIEDIPTALENSLKRLQLDYLDLSSFLVHSPYLKNDAYVESDVAKAWRLMEELRRSGKVRSIGISNFRKHHVENLLKRQKSSLRSIRFGSTHTYKARPNTTIAWNQDGFLHGTRAPYLAEGKHLDTLLEELAEKCKAAKSTILIAWQLSRGIIVLNMTKKKERVEEFFAALNIKLEGEDFDKITSIGQDKHLRTPTLDDKAYVAQIVAEINRLRSQINDMAVCRLVASLSGKTCTIQHSDKVGQGALMGGSNYHTRSPWLLRVPRVGSYEVGLPESLVEHLVSSEYATLRFLETTQVPAPRAYGYGIRGRDKEDHGVGVSFLLIEHLPGEAWTGEGIKEQNAKVLSGLASILNEVAQHLFPKAGSLVPHASSLSRMSAVASNRFLALSPDGPFDDAESYYASFAEQYLALICGGQLYTEYPVDAYLVYRFLKDHVSQLASRDANESGEFFLKTYHVLIDEDFNITGIIDWEMARTVPRLEAFGPSLVTADMNALCAGKVCLTENDRILARELGKLSPQLADCSVDEKTRRFFWGLALEADWTDAKPLAVAILTVFGVDQRWEEWREHALKRYQGDGRLQRLLRGCS